jgi:hypothetical protein
MTPTLVARGMSDSFNLGHVLPPTFGRDEKDERSGGERDTA